MSYKVVDGIAVFGEHAENTMEQAREVKKTAAHVALMADGHLGYIMPVGGVAAYHNKVSVPGVGYDIACGNCAIATDMFLGDLVGEFEGDAGSDLSILADDIQSHISFGMGRSNKADDAPTDHPLFSDPRWEAISVIAGTSEMQRLRQKAQMQLGTVGSGNHYVDVFADETGRIWVGVHFGSRGLGHSIATGFMNYAHNGSWSHHAKEQDTLLDLSEGLGQAYWEAMELAGTYAYAGREWVTRKVVSLLGATEVEMVHNHHNFAWKEDHILPGDFKGIDSIISRLVVVRKGATPAFVGQRGFVGGSMGDNAVILEGSIDAWTPFRDSAQHAALASTVHGAGRVMSRTQAAGKFKSKKMWSCTNRECHTELAMNTIGLRVDHIDQGNKRTSTAFCPKCSSKMSIRNSTEMVREGAISQEEMDNWVARAGVILRGGGLDEAPQAYRRLPDVLAAQGDTVKVLHTLRPLVVVMAGGDEYDPYKD